MDHSKAREERRITAAEIKNMRKTEGYTLTDCNMKVTKEFNVAPVLEKIRTYGRNWTRLVSRMPRKRLPTLVKTTDQKAEGSKEDH
jgi:hypothetical protein